MIAVYFRLTIPETPRYTIEINNDIDQAVKDVDIVVENKTKNVKDVLLGCHTDNL